MNDRRKQPFPVAAVIAATCAREFARSLGRSLDGFFASLNAIVLQHLEAPCRSGTAHHRN
jgi:hypothetical protein